MNFCFRHPKRTLAFIVLDASKHHISDIERKYLTGQNRPITAVQVKFFYIRLSRLDLLKLIIRLVACNLLLKLLEITNIYYTDRRGLYSNWP